MHLVAKPRSVPITIILFSALALSACGDEPSASTEGDLGDSEEETLETVEVSVTPSGMPIYVAAELGLFEKHSGLNFDVQQVGTDQAASVFLAGDSPMGWMAPAEVARYNSEGEDIRYVNTAGATNMINGLVIRARDSDKYHTIADLAGESVGNPGTGTATWATFKIMARLQHDMDADNDFENVTADSGALLALLESGEIEAALLFSGQSAAVLSNPQFQTIWAGSKAWQEIHGQSMVVDGLAARASWLVEYEDHIEGIVDAVDEAVKWMKNNPGEFSEGGRFADWAEAGGWHADQETYEGIIELLQNGEWTLTSDDYDERWIDAAYELVEEGKGVLVDIVPPKSDIFYPPFG